MIYVVVTGINNPTTFPLTLKTVKSPFLALVETWLDYVKGTAVRIVVVGTVVSRIVIGIFVTEIVVKNRYHGYRCQGIIVVGILFEGNVLV